MIKLLVVDDEAEICDFLKAFFSDRDFDVDVAVSGETAFQKVQDFRPHVVLLDIKMGKVDGISVLRQIKEKFPQTKVIMVTALETTEKIEEAMRYGADNYITKPLSLEYLEHDVREKIANLVVKP